MGKIVEKAHAEFSASSSHRWLACPGSIELCKTAPTPAKSRFADEGTAAHSCLEFLLKNKTRLSDALKMAPGDEEMIEHAHTAVLWIDEQIGENDELLVETRVDASPYTCPDQFGTLDVAIIREFDRLTVIDYKYGAGFAVEPEYQGDCNPQLAYYALGLSHQFHHNFSEVELVVIQPRAFHESGETIRSAVFPVSHLLGWGKKFSEGVSACKKPNAKLSSGSWCKFCPAVPICPEIKNEMNTKAEVVFSDETGLVSIPEPKMITIPKLSQTLNALPVLKSFIDAVEEHAFHLLMKGIEIPGYKLVEKRGIRKWIDEEKATADAKREWGDWAFTDPKLLSPAQLEKKLKGPSGESWIANRVSKTSSGLTLANEKDKRPAMKPLDEIFLDESKT